jgi:pimeloyl-ACP methyl ester carboxylesterase
MFRGLIPLLADRYHVIAPDLPGFGFTEAPQRGQFKYTFDNLAGVIDDFTHTIGLDHFAIYVFDYGAPVGFRLALNHPERVTAIISQNGNAYEEGLSDGWNPIQKYWKEPTEANRAALRDFLKPETTRFQYVHGVSDETLVAPESYTLDSTLLARPGKTISSLTCSSITRVTLRSIRSFKSTSVHGARHCSRCGATPTHSSYPPVPKHSPAITRTRRSTFMTPAILRLKPMSARSQTRFATSLAAS